MNFSDYKDIIIKNLIPSEAFRPFPLYNEREKWAEIPGDYREFIINKAEEYKDYQWPCLPAAYYLDFYRNGNRTRYENIIFHKRRLPLMYLTAAECIEGRGRFFDDIINGVWTTLDEASWVVPAHNRQVKDLSVPNFPLPDTVHDDNIYLDLFSGECGGVLSWVYKLMHDALPEEAWQVSERLLFEIDRRILTPFLNNNFAWMGFEGQSVNNWDPWITSNVLICAAFACKDEEKRKAVVKKALGCLQFFINGYYPDGGCDEGPGYWTAAGASLYDCLDIINDMTGGKVDLCTDELIKNICAYIYKMQATEKYFVNYADASPSVSPDAMLIYRMGKHSGDENMIKMGTALFNRQKTSEKFFMFDGCDCLIYRTTKKLFCYKDLKEEKNTSFPLIRDVYFPGIEVMTARKTEGSDEGLFFSAKGGSNGESHNHNDIGSFIIYCGGLPAVIDIGTGVYEKKTFSDRRYEILQMQSLYHNLPAIDGTGQKEGKKFTSSDTSYQCTDDKASFSLDIKNAYEKSTGIVSWKRSFNYLRAEDRITLDESFILDSRKTVDFIFMVPVKPDINNNSAEIRLGENNIFTVGFQENLTSSCEIFDTSSDANLKRSWGNCVYRIKLTAKNIKEGSFRFTFKKA